MLSNLFNGAEQTTTGGQQFEKTAVLTQQANTVVTNMLSRINKIEGGTDEAQTAANLVLGAKNSIADTDALLDRYADLTEIETYQLRDLDEETVAGMLKSQQSKRSKSRSKAEHFPMFKSMLVAAVAENILRQLYNKPKYASGGTGAKSKIDWSDEGLEQLAEDQYALRAAIRNIQSKKTMEKKRLDHDESSDRWQELIRIEAKLKSLRTAVDVQPNKTNEVRELIYNIEDIDKLKAAELKEIIKEIKEMLA